jgi:hypothetical protein
MRLEGWPQSTTLNTILRGSPKTARTSRVNAIAFIPGMTAISNGEVAELPSWRFSPEIGRPTK